MKKLFGTDGIRGIANRHPITTEMGAKLGGAAVLFCAGKGNAPAIVLGRDTRASGRMLQDAIISGILAAGGSVQITGVIPTPGVAFLTRESGAGMGIVVSASHNPWEYNGFKFFSPKGFKLSDGEEEELESLIFSKDFPVGGQRPGYQSILAESTELYTAFLRHTLPENFSLSGMRIVLDCANGATFRAAPAVFESLDAEFEALFVHPDGHNINKDCGSEHTRILRKRVRETGADLGLAFDGDGDRLIAVDEKGDVLTGDQVLMICAKGLKEAGQLDNDLVVSTVMSNIGLKLALQALSLQHIATEVGDRHVAKEMTARQAVLGGEASGHMIFLRHHSTGDGILSALQLLNAVQSLNQPLSQLAKLMTVFPQVCVNVPVEQKPNLSEIPELTDIIRRVEEKLGEQGKVLVRYSGTEPVCRVMVEGIDREAVEKYVRKISDVLKRIFYKGVS